MENPAVNVHSILFRPEGLVEITYAEKRNVSKYVTNVNTIVLNQEKYFADLKEIQLMATDLIDEALEDLSRENEDQ